MNESSLPPDAASGSEPVDVLRLWVVGEELECALQPDLFDDPGDWGSVLADTIRHIADARRQQEGVPAAQTVRRILDVLEEELRTVAGENEMPPRSPT